MLNIQHNYFRAKNIAFSANGNGTLWLINFGDKSWKSLVGLFWIFLLLYT